MIQLYIYIHSSSYSFPLWFITGYWIQFPVLYSRTLLFIHSLYTSLHLLIQTPNPTLSQPPAFLKNFYWSTVALPCRVCFHCTIKWIHYKYTQIPSFFGFPSHLRHHRSLSRVPRAIQSILISYLFYWVGKIPWRRERLPTPILWPGEFHGLFHGISKSRTLSDFHLHTLVCVRQSQSLRTSDLPLRTW